MAEQPPIGAWLGGRRAWMLITIAAAGCWAAIALGLDLRDLIPNQGGLSMARELLSHALRPALSYESTDLPAGIQPLPIKALAAAGTTIKLAAAAISVSAVVGLLLGFAASSAPWTMARGRAGIGPGAVIYGASRVLIALMRSTHELLWAVLLLAALGLYPLSAVLAISIPYSGTLAKVFSEMLDETPREASLALRAAGASPAQVFLFGLLPQALPDLCAYTFYRFECALRSSAVLGFFGFPTLGFHISAAFENLHYGELWTYLYTLAALVVLADLWSGALRRRLLA